MATGGYRAGGGSTTDFLEEWKAKREKMRAKQNPPGPLAPGGGSGDAAGKPPAGALPTSGAPGELNNNLPGAAAPAAPGPGGVNCVGGSAAPTRGAPGPRRTEDEPAAGAGAASSSSSSGTQPARGDEEEPDGAPEKGKSSGPSARKGKGQIEKRKLREKRRSTGVVNIPAAECLDEYEDDEAGQKERKREDAITQQNTMQNEAASLLDAGTSYLLQEPSRAVSGRYKSTTTASEEDVSSRHPRTDRSAISRYRDANASGNLVTSSTLEKKIEELEKEIVRERQENLRLVRLMQDKEEMIGKLKEEIDLLNRDLDDIEDENEQLKQENKTLLKVVGQLTR
ncbi:PRKC apoptosis WT1 regulator protein [Talpa occidentalis]|uniref:PRKC apoptosis WT1 regulator protein n=1 Tax=Talpa occidentalis TaxID=50954 RepID=UPI0018909148|nr:PRKC apoptosis WT1 regulator protein [Talpa occidentalis]